MKKVKSPVHTSIMSGKLEGFRSVSTNTLTNDFCIKMNQGKKETICSHCYSHAMLSTYRKSTATALQRNSDLLSARVLKTEEIPLFKVGEAVRFSAHGELINGIHMRNYVKIAELNPQAVFTLWTKRRDIVSQYCKRCPVPDNLIFIYSNPKLNDVMTTPPRFFHRTFNNVDTHPDENCTGQQCKDCMICYTIDHPTKVIIEKVK